jgi:hypothetical protein|tara:strand:+ start:395 stop:1249 length:855 start_codon:yes stop_codon:yes gene_type:complete
MKYNTDISYSKSKFSLIKYDKKIFIKKKPLKIDKREFQSITKQNNFKSFYVDKYLVQSAKIIYDKNFIKENKSYLVEFANGKNGEEILLSGNREEINILNNFYFKYFFKENKLKNITLRSKKKIIQKIKIIKKNIKIKKIDPIFNFIKTLLKKKLYTYSHTTCHGDFTLSNIIIDIKSKKITLIDFQSTYEDNVLQDLSKMYQEFTLNWTSRKFNDINRLRSAIVYQSIINNNFWKKINKKMKNSLKLEFTMTILRIVPYIDEKDNKTINWIFKSFDTINKFRF